MPVNIRAELKDKKELIPGIFKFSVKSKEISSKAKPGNFIEIRVNDDIEPFLRRPISIYNIDKKNEIIEFIFQVKGKGTSALGKKNIGDKIDIIGPLGYGTFKFEEYKKIAIIGGGIGIFPLYELAKNIKEEKKNITTYLGFRDKSMVLLEDEFKSVSDDVIVSTDDGSYGNKGFAIDILKKDIELRKI